MSTIREINDVYLFDNINAEHHHYGAGVSTKALGVDLEIDSTQLGRATAPSVRSDDTGFNGITANIPNSPLLIDYPVQTDDTFEYIPTLNQGKYERMVQNGFGTGSYVSDYTFKSGSVLPTTDVIVTFYAGDNAGDISPDNQMFQFNVTPGQWPGANGEFKITTDGLGFDTQAKSITVISSTSQWSMRFNANNTQPFYKASLQTYQTMQIAIANSPYATYKVPLGTVVPFAVANTEYPLTDMVASGEYAFTLDEVTGIYTYNGIPSNFDGNFLLTMLGSTSNMVLQFRLYIDTGSGFVQSGDSIPYEISNSGYKTTVIPSDAWLNPGDQIQIRIECSKTGSLTVGSGQKKIRNFGQGAPA